MILVFGKHGQLARELALRLPQAQFCSSQEVNFLDHESVLRALNTFRPSLVINAAAYTAVDKAETEKAKAMMINAETPGIIARWCRKNYATLFHYSTDYVFDGSGHQPWLETDTPEPINHYGLTKFLGEEEILATECQSYIFRVGWIYSPWGFNFRNTVLRLAQEREELKIVDDQWGSPTQAKDIADHSCRVIHNFGKPETLIPGLYHLRFNEYKTWYQFALQIIEQARLQGIDLKVKHVHPITSEEFPTLARRPKNSRLGTIHQSLYKKVLHEAQL